MSQQLPRNPSGILPRGRAGPGPGLQGTGSPEPPAGEKMGKILEFQPWEALGEGLVKGEVFREWNLGFWESFFREILILEGPKGIFPGKFPFQSPFRASQRNFSREIPILEHPKENFPGKFPFQRVPKEFFPGKFPFQRIPKEFFQGEFLFF